MDLDDRRRRIAANPYEASYTSQIINEHIILPEECLKELTTDSLIMTLYWEPGVICLFTPENFEVVRKNINLLNTMDVNARNIKRRVVGCAVNVKINNGSKIHIDSEYLLELGFDTSNKTLNKEPFDVVLLRYRNMLEIVSSSLFKELYS